jgi:hypothetical protein
MRGKKWARPRRILRRFAQGPYMPKKADPSVIPSGKSQTFIYTGEQIPFQVIIANLSNTQVASYTTISGPKNAWQLWSTVAHGQAQSLFVQWPSGEATFTNLSPKGVNIQVGGLGIFPKQ